MWSRGQEGTENSIKVRALTCGCEHMYMNIKMNSMRANMQRVNVCLGGCQYIHVCAMWGTRLKQLCYVAQAGLKLMNPPALAFRILGF